ncbi:hypothetical protein HPP92_009758 [Vanilla planifolia]|uniref:RING-type domain-containing protein n=1 Tax=Vanilla planifolia TaxID=51239 RepID=A0A835V6T9_VANPL|nr:hypothetical protein HPP92_009969 [Vanilla planifolia]KAG0487660.1 hypothetical protein HPP92_009755 [Vanilla planifolia]KAG0487663.1 hypothetical protein HPP92_009758 [Vanilla planifolia]
MEDATIPRSRTTLLDRLTAAEPITLRSLLAGSGRAVTLASILEAEKPGGRTLLDVIQEEEEEEEPIRAERPAERAEGRPVRVSLMTLLALTERAPAEEYGTPAEDENEPRICCVCMVRRKGAAFIPCGHTFCRACSRDLFTGRGSCPVCNGVIFDILDIF